MLKFVLSPVVVVGDIVVLHFMVVSFATIRMPRESCYLCEARFWFKLVFYADWALGVKTIPCPLSCKRTSSAPVSLGMSKLDEGRSP